MNENLPLWILAAIMTVVGIAGTVLPAVPGVPLVFVGLLIGAWIDGFQKVSGLTVGILGALTVVALIADVGAGALGAKRVKASRQAVVGALIGTVVGLFMGLPGFILGPFIGAAVGEFVANPDVVRAGEVGWATWMGMVIGVVAKLGLSFAMVAIFITAYLWK